MFRTGSWGFGLIGGLGVAVMVLPALATAQNSSIQVTIDAPVDSATISNGQTIQISGWAVDASAAGGTGIEAVEISVDTQNGLANQRTFANYGTARPDVAQAFGRSDWLQSGFNLTWTPQGLPDGQHTIQVWAHSSEGISRFGSVTVAAATTPTPAARSTEASSPRTPTPTTITLPGLRISSQMGCSLDVTLVAPGAYMQRCPNTTPTPTR